MAKVIESFCFLLAVLDAEARQIDLALERFAVVLAELLAQHGLAPFWRLLIAVAPVYDAGGVSFVAFLLERFLDFPGNLGRPLAQAEHITFVQLIECRPR